MRYNLLGKTGLYVSELCLGTMTFGEQKKGLDEASALPPEYPGWMTHWQNRDPRGVPVK